MSTLSQSRLGVGAAARVGHGEGERKHHRGAPAASTAAAQGFTTGAAATRQHASCSAANCTLPSVPLGRFERRSGSSTGGETSKEARLPGEASVRAALRDASSAEMACSEPSGNASRKALLTADRTTSLSAASSALADTLVVRARCSFRSPAEVIWSSRLSLLITDMDRLAFCGASTLRRCFVSSFAMRMRTHAARMRRAASGNSSAQSISASRASEITSMYVSAWWWPVEHPHLWRQASAWGHRRLSKLLRLMLRPR
jgi:hypothetical protein